MVSVSWLWTIARLTSPLNERVRRVPSFYVFLSIWVSVVPSELAFAMP